MNPSASVIPVSFRKSRCLSIYLPYLLRDNPYRRNPEKSYNRNYETRPVQYSAVKRVSSF